MLLLAVPCAALGQDAPIIKPWYLSFTTGLPMPVGGLLGLEFQRRFDPRHFARVAVGTGFIVSGASVSYGLVHESGSYSLFGLDAVVIPPFYGGNPLYLPGAHIGYGWEWFSERMRYALELNVGFPWLGGLRFAVGL